MVEPAGFDELFGREVGPLLQLATAITGSPEMARDVVQEAFARAVARWSRVSGYDQPGAWLRRVVIRLAVRERDRGHRQSQLPALGEEVSSAGRDVDLEVALGRLDPRDRAVLVLHYLLDLPVADIAAAMHLRPNTVKVRLHRARQRLRELLEEGHVHA